MQPFAEVSGDHAGCAGCVLTLPASVWLSWQPHLGGPKLVMREDGIHEFADVKSDDLATSKGWIQIFTADAGGVKSPNPLRITKTIRASSGQLAQLAFEKAPTEAMTLLTSSDLLRTTLQRRIAEFWPTLWPKFNSRARKPMA